MGKSQSLKSFSTAQMAIQKENTKTKTKQKENTNQVFVCVCKKYSKLKTFPETSLGENLENSTLTANENATLIHWNLYLLIMAV